MRQEKNHALESFSSRLRGEMQRFSLESAADLSKFADVAWTTANQWLEGSIPRKLALMNLASRLEVTAKWLETGVGDREPVNLRAVQALRNHVNETGSSPETDAVAALYSDLVLKMLPRMDLEKLIEVAEYLQTHKPPGSEKLISDALTLAREKLNELKSQQP